MTEFAVIGRDIPSLLTRSRWIIVLVVWGCVFFLIGRYFNTNVHQPIVIGGGIQWGSVFGGLNSQILGTTVTLVYSLFCPKPCLIIAFPQYHR